MKRLLWLPVLTLFAFLPFSYGQQQVGWLRLTCEKQPAAVQIDSTSISPSRDTLLTLTPGIHSITALSPNRADWLVRDFHAKISIHASDTATVVITFPRYILLTSRPAGAFVCKNDSLLGRTPYIGKWRALKFKTIQVKKRGYFTQQIFLSGRNKVRFTVVLQKDPAFWEQFRIIQRKKQLRKKRLHWSAAGTGGVALASGMAAYFLKKRANEAYNRYRNTPYPDQIKRFYDEAHHYDNFAGTTYLFFEVNLIASAVLLLQSLSK